MSKMFEALHLPAPAKLNLFLRITGLRPDGYHLLQTVFQLLDYGDELRFSPRADSKIRLQCSIPALNTPDNLVYRAAHTLQTYARSKGKHQLCGVDITLEKQLPMGGGVGGGSSNAATTLIALNQAWDTKLSMPQLSELGQGLGADVPVFIQGQTAWAEGIGEKLQAIELIEKWYLVLVPDCQVSTAEVFSHKDLTRNSSAITVAAFLKQGGQNDCQPLVQRLYPEVKHALDWLAQFSHPQLTGTGACIFASFTTKQEAQAVLAQKPTSLQGFLAKGVNQSPLHKQLSLNPSTGV